MHSLIIVIGTLPTNIFIYTKISGVFSLTQNKQKPSVEIVVSQL